MGRSGGWLQGHSGQAAVVRGDGRGSAAEGIGRLRRINERALCEKFAGWLGSPAPDNVRVCFPELSICRCRCTVQLLQRSQYPHMASSHFGMPNIGFGTAQCASLDAARGDERLYFDRVAQGCATAVRFDHPQRFHHRGRRYSPQQSLLRLAVGRR